MSKAFLSHSSIDKGYVKQVFDKLGRGLAEYDACTFEHGMLNVGAIEAALARCSLFVLFVSRHSLKSAFVNHEAQLALERLGGGTLKRVLIFCLDRESFEEIHRRLKEFNIVTEPRPAAAAARKIRGDLHALNEDAPGSVPNLSFGHDLSPNFHPVGSRIRSLFGPVRSGVATGRGAKPSGKRSAPACCGTEALRAA